MCRKIPASLHFKTANPNIDFTNMPVQVVTEVMDWPESEKGLIGGVSSFGFGGTNAHAILCNAPPPSIEEPEVDDRIWVLPFSAHSPEALRRVAAKYLALLSQDEPPPLYKICLSSLTRRDLRKHRMAVVGISAEIMANQLDAYLNETPENKGSRKPVIGTAVAGKNKTCLVFSGQGPQWYAMGRELYLTNDYYREMCDELGTHFDEFGMDWDIREELSKMSVEESLLDQTRVAQVVLFLFEVSFAHLWEHFGLEFSAVLGHSLGEIPAAHICGALDLDTACKLIFARANLMQEATGKGKMCAVNLTAEEADNFVVPFQDFISVASYNAPKSVVLSGDEEHLTQCLNAIQQAHPDCRMQYLPVNYVFHSPQLEPLVPRLLEKVSFVEPSETKVSMYSTVTGELISGKLLTPDYWSKQIRRPVYFQKAISAAIKDGYTTFVEISPHPVLSMYIRMIADSLSVNVNAVPTLIRKEKERLTLASNVASAWAGGAKMDFMKFLFEGNAEAFKSKPGTICGDVQLPILSWDPQRFWINTTPPWLKQQPTTSARTAPLEKCMYESVWVPTQPAPKSRNDKLTLVLFHDHMTNETPTRFSISESLLQHLKQHNIVHVELGSSFSRTGKDSFTSSTSAESLAALADELPKDISGFVYCWSNLSSECDCSTTVLGPVRLLQALNKTSPCKTKFWVITHACFGVGNAMNMNPFQSPIKGIFETAAFEYPQMKPTVVDISSQADIPLLAKEISNSTIESSMESTVALLNGQKLVKRMKFLPTSDSSKWPSLAIDPKGTYLITGGLSGFGLEIANWLTEKGAKSLILCGRSAPKPEAALRIEKMRKNGEVSIEVAQVDVSDIQQLSAVVKKANNLMGIFHVAGVFGAARIQDLTTESIKNVLDSKIVGSWNLHLASQTVSTLQHFVLFSSLASAVPQGGQAHYTAANCFLDALAQFRRKLHLPALSIQYKQDTRAEEMSAKVGLYTLNVADTLRALGYLAGTKTPAQVLVARVDWGKYVGDLPVVSGLVPKKEEAAAEEEEKKPVKTQEEIQNWLTAEFAEALQSSPTAIDIDTPLRNFGVESMVVVNITAALSDWLGVRVSPALVYDFPTISLLSKHLAELMQPHKETLPVVPTWTTSTPTDDSEVIALVGFALRFPGGCTDSDSYWSLLKNGVDAITEIPQSRFNVHAFYDADMQKKGKMNSKWGGFISDIDMFDAEFWGISPRESERLDPQQRLMMEMAWEALEDSGHPASMLAGSKTGLFVGLSASDYGQLQLLDENVADAYFATGSFLCMNANRLSYLLDFRGPSVALDTACSSSLVALHLACNALRNNECTTALAGGVNAILTPTGGLTLTKTGALSPDGRCFVFDARANGYVRSEGCGMLVLKKLSDALADKDKVYCVIAGTGVNQDGKSNGLTAPNGLAQQALYTDTWHNAHRNLSEAGYFECHGTGTSLGDHIEVDSLGEVLSKHIPMVNGAYSDSERVVIGSVKSNIGHLECASGMASIIKIALSMTHGFIPKSIHFENPNPHINFNGLPISVSQGGEWNPNKKKLAGVSSFGFGGTNAHAVIESAPAVDSPFPADDNSYILSLSARSSISLRASAVKLSQFLENHPEIALRDVAYTHLLRREQHPQRASFVCQESQRAPLCKALVDFGSLEGNTGIRTAPSSSQRLVMLFSGQGPQHFKMAKQLIKENVVFRNTLEKIDSIFSTMEPPFSVCREILNSDESKSALGETVCAQRVLFAIQVALVEVYKQMGVVPQAVVGHSLGEIAAFHVAGVLSLEDATRLIYVRSEVMNKATGLGKMAAVGLPLPECEQLISSHSGKLAVAVVNSEENCVLSGDAEALESVVTALKAKNIYAKYLPVNYAFHCHLLDNLLPELDSKIGALHLSPKPESIPIYSTLTGTRFNGTDLQTAYWTKQIRNPVQFHQAILELIKQRHCIFVELSPHPVLAHYVSSTLRTSPTPGHVIASMKRDTEESKTLLQSIGFLHECNVKVDFDWMFDEKAQFVRTPKYSWNKQRHWFQPTNSEKGKLLQSKLQSPATTMPFLSQEVATLGADVKAWRASVSAGTPLEWEYDHKGFGSVLIPGVTYIECSLEAATAVFGKGPQVITDVKFLRPLFLPAANSEPIIQTSFVVTSPYEATVSLYSTLDGETPNPQYMLHATTTVHRERDSWLAGALPQPESPAAIIARCNTASVSGQDYYTAMWERGLQLGPAFKSIRALHVGNNELLGVLHVPDHIATNLDKYCFHPPVLDATMQCLGAIFFLRNEDIHGIYLPFHMDRVRFFRSPVQDLYCHVKITTVSPRALIGDLVIFTESGEPIACIDGFRCNYVEDTRRSTDVFYHTEWAPITTSPAPPTKPNGKFVVFSEGVYGDELVSILRKSGGSVFSIRKANSVELNGQDLACPSNELPSVISHIEAQADGQPIFMVFMWAVKQPANEGLLDAILFLQALGKSALQPRLWLVTAGSQEVTEQDTDIDPHQSALWGLSNVLLQEYAAFSTRMIDLSLTPTANEITTLAHEILSPGKDNLVGIRSTSLWGNRLMQSVVPSLSRIIDTTASKGAYRLEISKRGVLDSLTLCHIPRMEPKEGEVEIQVRASSLNFRDVMRAMGLYPAEDDSTLVGLEAAGTIVRVGKGVTGFAVGDPVIAIANGTFASHFVTPAHLCVKKPSNLTMEEAVASTGVLLTAYEGLVRVAHIKKGERVLVHLASGGVGIAAVQLCQHYGCEVFATVGKKEKREFLVNKLGIPEDHIFNSRSLTFADQIMKITHGEGVDVVLNSLMGEGLVRSYHLLRHKGRFIEIGKRDIFENSKLPLKPFAKNLLVASVAIDVLCDSDPVYFSELLREVESKLEDGTIKPIPYTAFPITDAVHAFRLMAAANHIGKILVTVDLESTVHATDTCPTSFDPDAIYMLTGGLGALGTSVAQWMCWHGATKIDFGVQEQTFPSTDAISPILLLWTHYSQS
ncbi:polyketide synthase [Pelomyxa schiedti]|nr:polyketide synthase [Pelomyxa schiedti]